MCRKCSTCYMGKVKGKRQEKREKGVKRERKEGGGRDDIGEGCSEKFEAISIGSV